MQTFDQVLYRRSRWQPSTTKKKITSTLTFIIYTVQQTLGDKIEAEKEGI